MIGNLFKFIGSIPIKLIKKSSVVDELDVTYSNIRLNVKPVLESVRSEMAKKSDILLSTIPFFKGSILDTEYKKVSVLLAVISNVIAELENKRKNIDALFKDVPTTMSTKAMTTNQALLLNINDNITMFSEMSSDIILIIAEKYNESESVYADGILEQKKALLYDYYNILKTYQDMNSSVMDLGNMVITNTQAVATILADSKITIPDKIVDTKGFVGNIIYHSGLFFVDFKKDWMKRTIRSKEYTELLLADYELKQATQYDPKLETLIENAKDRINEYEVKIEKLRLG